MSITRIGSAVGTTSATLPAHQVGDLILIFAYRDGNATAPSLPAGYISISNTGANSNSLRIGYKFATSTSETSGTWTSATSVIAVVYRGASIGASAVGGTSSTTVNYPTVSLLRTNNTSWVVGGAGHRSVDTNVQNPPTGMSNVNSVLDATDELGVHDTNGTVSSWSSTNVSVGGTTLGWRSAVVELVNKTTFTLTAANNSLTLTGNNATLTKAAAPVIVGRSTTASTGVYIGENYPATVFTSTVNGVISEIKAELQHLFGGGDNAAIAGYSDSSLSPNSLLFHSSPLLLSDGTKSFKSFTSLVEDVTDGLRLSNGQKIWLAVWEDFPGVISAFSETGSTNQTARPPGTPVPFTWNSTFGTPTFSAIEMSIHAVVTPDPVTGVTLTAEDTSYTLTLQDSLLKVSRKLTAENNSIPLNFSASSFTYGDTLPASSTSFSLTVNNANLVKSIGINEFQFYIPESSKVSAGIFEINSGKLIRTLFSNSSYSAGNHVITWDGNNDAGSPVAEGSYKAIALTNNITYTWSIVGNNSDTQIGSTVVRYLRGIQGMAIYNNKAYYCTGFQEGNPSISFLNLSTSFHSKTDILLPSNGDVDQETLYPCTDGVRVYWAGIDTFDANKSFVFATKISDNLEHQFSSGSSTSTIYGRTYNWAIDISTAGSTAYPSGIAVQTTGDYLFVSHSGQNQLRVFNKSTGAFVRNITVTSPRNIFIDSNDILWMISATNSVTKHTINSDGTISSATLTLSGITKPMAVSVTPDGNTVAVIDGSTVQQIKAFSTSSGSSSWTLGTSGGYSSSSAVTNTKFMFDHPYMTDGEYVTRTFICFDADTNLYFGDPGNMRVMKFDSSRNFVDSIMATHMLYNVSYDKNNHQRIFADFLEYEVIGGSWSLKNNWAYNVTTSYIPDFELDYRNIFQQCVTYDNGKTYAFIDYFDGGTRYPERVELVDGGNIRYTGQRLDAFQDFNITPEGDLIWIEGERYTAGGTVTLKKQLHTGYSSDNPTFAAETTVGTFPTVTTSDPAYRAYFTPFISDNNLIWTFSNDKENTGYHLGAIKAGGSAEYIVKTAPSINSSVGASYPNDGRFEIGNNVEYAGGDLSGVDEHLVFTYIGEFWNNSQTNKWHHYYRNGLLLNIFGITTPEANALDGWQAPRQAAGNNFSNGIIKLPSGELRFIGCDESVHSGAQVWETSNIDSIQEHETIVRTPGATGHYILTAESSSVALTVNNSNLTQSAPSGVTLTANYSPLNLSGQNTNLLYSRILPAEQSQLTYSSNASNINRGYTLSSTKDDITITFPSSGIGKGFRLEASNFISNLQAGDAIVVATRKLLADGSSIALSITDAGLLDNQLTPVDTTIINVVSNDTSLKFGRRLGANSDSINSSFSASSFISGKAVNGTTLEIDVPVNSANFLVDRILSGETVQVNITDSSSGLYKGRALLAGNSIISVNGNNANIKNSRLLLAEYSNVSSTFTDGISSSSRQVALEGVNINLVGNDSSVTINRKLQADCNILNLTLMDANAWKGFVLIANNNGMNLTGVNSNLLRGHKLNADTENISVTDSESIIGVFTNKRRIIVIS